MNHEGHEDTKDTKKKDLLFFISLCPSCLRVLCGFLILGLIMFSAVGCTGGGRLALRSTERDTAVLVGNFNRGFYGFVDRNRVDVLLIDGDPDNPKQAVHLNMYWQPRAGKTPIDSNATNATINYIVFNPDGAGVYSGAGFLLPQTDPGESTLRADVLEASLRLMDASESFADPLGLTTASGGFTARRNDLATQRALRQIRVLLGDKLGYPRLVGR